jgi:hypothetical protein
LPKYRNKNGRNYFLPATWKTMGCPKRDWKLLGNPAIRFETFDAKDSLFLVNLKEDIGETTNLAAKYPEKVKELEEQFEEWLERSRM